MVLPHFRLYAANTRNNPTNPFRKSSLRKRILGLHACHLGASDSRPMYTISPVAFEIGTILGITERTVTFHVTSSLYKFDVTNKTQAVAKALLLRLI